MGFTKLALSTLLFGFVACYASFMGWLLSFPLRLLALLLKIFH